MNLSNVEYLSMVLSDFIARTVDILMFWRFHASGEGFVRAAMRGE